MKRSQAETQRLRLGFLVFVRQLRVYVNIHDDSLELYEDSIVDPNDSEPECGLVDSSDSDGNIVPKGQDYHVRATATTATTTMTWRTTAPTSSYPTTVVPTTARVMNLKVSSFINRRIDNRRLVESRSAHDKIPKCNDPSEVADNGASGRTSSVLVPASSTHTPMEMNPLR